MESNNSKNRNSGNRNSGNRNSGDGNSGYGNSGNWNSGNWNSGNRNSGYWNSGYWNSGDGNSGYGNSGYGNSGDRNSGYGNSGNWNSGIFCTTEPNVRLFNKDTNLKWSEILHPDFSNYSLTEWVRLDDMTDEEKAEYPQCHVVNGYLKTYTYKEMWKRGWEKDTEENKQRFLNLPNFDADIFFEITGIDVRKSDKLKELEQQQRELAKEQERLADEIRRCRNS